MNSSGKPTVKLLKLRDSEAPSLQKKGPIVVYEKSPTADIYICNLDYFIEEQKVRDLFGRYGIVTKVTLPYDHTYRSGKGYGFVTMSQMKEAINAITSLDGYDFDGRKLSVRLAQRQS